VSANVFLGVDRALWQLGKSPWKPLRRRAIARAIEWIVRRQDATGQWGGIQPPMLNCVLALTQMGFATDHPAVMRGIQGVDDFLVQCEGTLMYQPCVSPNWDTALALKLLGGVRLRSDARTRSHGWCRTDLPAGRLVRHNRRPSRAAGRSSSRTTGTRRR
jgi:squalene cyclase